MPKLDYSHTLQVVLALCSHPRPEGFIHPTVSLWEPCVSRGSISLDAAD